MRNRRRNRNNVNANMMAIEQEHTYADDIHYFIEKLRNKGNKFTVSLYSNNNNPEYLKNYIEFIQQYIDFTLTNISEIYSSLKEWIQSSPMIRSKIQFVDSNDIDSEVSSYITAYLDKKLWPSVNSVALSLLGIEETEAAQNFETHNIPALAFLGPPGTSKTYSIVAALKDLSKGQGNNKIAGWLHYDITKHETTTSPLILPTANQDVKDDPLPGLAMLRSINKPEIDKALSENIYTKTVNKIISTFAYILIAGKETGRISLSNEVESTLKKGIDFSSIELDLWKFVVTKELDENSIEYLSNAFKNVIHGFTKVTQALSDNKALIDNNASKLIDVISNIEDDDFGISDPASYVRDFRKVAWVLHKFITFGLVPIIAGAFRKFIQTNKIVESTKIDDINERYKNIDILDGIMYIYNKIHNDYLHRIISTLFLIKALVNTSGEYENLFSSMVKNLIAGLHKLLQDYYNKIKNSEIKNRLALEEISQNSSKDKNIKAFNFYNKIYMFLLNIQVDEQSQYVLLDQMFINTVLSALLSSGGDSLHGNVESEGGNSMSQYRDNKLRRYSSVDYTESEVDYFSNSKLSFVDHISLLSDIINDLHEVRRFYSNMPTDMDISGSHGSQTTLEKLKGEFGRSFIDLGGTGISDVSKHISTISTIFKFIDLIKNEYTKGQHGSYKSLYHNKEYKALSASCKDALKDLFTKSLSIIVNNPRYEHILEMAKKAGLNDNIIFELIGEYMLSALDITESLRTRGVSYSFPPAIQVFLAKAKEAYYRYLKELRTRIAANLKLRDITSSVSTAMETLKPPLYVLFIDEIMTQLTQENFLFWLNIWNGLISPTGTTVDTYPPNLCFILAGNMPADTRLLGQVLAESSTEQDIKAIQAAAKEFHNIPINISKDTLNALGSRIRVKVVTYDYAYVLRTDDSIARKRTALFIKALTNGLLGQKELIRFANTAQDLLGGFYDYYKLIVEPRLDQMGEVVLSNEERMRLHAYIISLTAAPDNIPFNIEDIVPNSTINPLINNNDTYNRISLKVRNEVIRKATILNHLFNNKTFGKTIYEYMFGDYFNNNSEAVYFNRLINIAISPIILHLSFIHSYLAWNNMMRRVAQRLLDIAAKSKDNPEIVEAVTRFMKEIKKASKLLNTRMTKHESINSINNELGNRTDTNDRIENFQHEGERNSKINFIRSQSDPRLCDPEVGAVVSLLSLVFYHYIKYMKEFNVDISNSIITFCRKLEAQIRDEAGKLGELKKKEFNELILKIRNYFVDPEQDIKTREDYLSDASVFEHDLDRAVRINLLSFKPNILTVTLKDKNNESQSIEFNYKQDAYNSITVTLIPNVKDSDTGKGLTKDDIEAIKSLVAYTIYTHSLVMKKGVNNQLVFSKSLLDNILTTNAEQVPLVGNLAVDFFRPSEENKLFLIETLRNTDRWFTNVTSSVVKYVTIMTILKHILTYNRQAGRNMINEFMNVVISSNNMTRDVRTELENILNDFSNLLHLARKAVFTPLADGGKAASNKQYIKFTYKYYGSDSEAYEGYYIRPDNQVNFGRLDFVFEELKTSKIVQYEKPDDLINTIAERFLQYIKSKDKRSTTSFFPIHLISHINLSSAEAEQKENDKTIQDFSDLSSLIYNNSDAKQLTNPSSSMAMDGDKRHDDFYEIKGKEYSIISIAKVLNNRLRSIKELQSDFQSIDKLLKLNTDLREAAENQEQTSFIHLLRKNVQLLENYQMINLNGDIFELLQKVKSRYPSVTDYIKTWNNEQNKILDFFRSLIKAAAQSNVDTLTETVVGIYSELDKYIVEVTEKLLKISIKDENVNEMLKNIQTNKNKINEFLRQKIQEVIHSLNEEYIGHTTLEEYKAISDWNPHIEYQIIVLTPLIKYSLAIILSNIFLIESEKSSTFWIRDKNSFYQELEKAIRNSYNKTIDPSKGGSTVTDYLHMIIRYILFDMNQYKVDNGQIKLSGALLARSPNYIDVSNITSSSTTGIHLVKPFFTNYNENEAKIERNEENNKKVITKREVFTQYVYREDEKGNPSLYCDIHHMPIKAVQFLDGTEKEVSSTITIYSSELPQRNPNEYVYTQLTFMQNMVVPRYKFAKSVLVNLLLIAGIQDIQQNLGAGDFGISSLSSSKFASFAVTNLYLYYRDEIQKSGLDAKKFIDMVIKNSSSDNERKPLHPLLASIMILFNNNNEEAREVKKILKVDYSDNNKGLNQYARRDDLINALRLRFYAARDIGQIKNTEYEMYSIYEPGVSIELGS